MVSEEIQHAGDEPPGMNDDCRADAPGTSELKTHARSERKGQGNKITNPRKSYRTKKKMEARYNTKHQGEKQPVQEESGNDFTDSKTLRRHPVIHSAENTYVCTQCGKGFASSRELGSHRRVHRERSYLCEDCGKGFKWSNDLKKSIIETHLSNAGIRSESMTSGEAVA